MALSALENFYIFTMESLLVQGLYSEVKVRCSMGGRERLIRSWSWPRQTRLCMPLRPGRCWAVGDPENNGLDSRPKGPIKDDLRSYINGSPSRSLSLPQIFTHPSTNPTLSSTNKHYGTLLSPPRCCIQNAIDDSLPPFPYVSLIGRQSRHQRVGILYLTSRIVG